MHVIIITLENDIDGQPNPKESPMLQCNRVGAASAPSSMRIEAAGGLLEVQGHSSPYPR